MGTVGKNKGTLQDQGTTQAHTVLQRATQASSTTPRTRRSNTWGAHERPSGTTASPWTNQGDAAGPGHHAGSHGPTAGRTSKFPYATDAAEQHVGGSRAPFRHDSVPLEKPRGRCRTRPPRRRTRSYSGPHKQVPLRHGRGGATRGGLTSALPARQRPIGKTKGTLQDQATTQVHTVEQTHLATVTIRGGERVREHPS